MMNRQSYLVWPEIIYLAIGSAFTGLLIFFLVADVSILDHNNIEWLIGRGDAETHFIGTAYFLKDQWRFPPGINPNYGLENSSSLVYTDSIPLWSLLAKLINSLWSANSNTGLVQVYGLYILISIQLLVAASYISLRFFSTNRTLCLVGGLLLALLPIPVWRLMPEIGHISLTSCYLLVSAIALYCLYQARHRVMRIGLVCIGFGVHPYIGVMLAGLWFSSTFDIYKTELAKLVSELLIGVIIILACMYIYGYFGFAFQVDAWGYGFFRGIYLICLIVRDMM